MPLTVVILFGLFAVQSRGTAKVAAFFGPITLIWFIAIAIAGTAHIAQNPGVLSAFNPLYGVAFLANHGRDRACDARRGLPRGHRLRGALCRSRPFRQRSDSNRLALRRSASAHPQLSRPGRAAARAPPDAIENPFYLLYPDWALLPMVGLATAATVIASQAVITGAFSLTNQAVQLGLLPRLQVSAPRRRKPGKSTSRASTASCWSACCFSSLQFRSSSALASAYGIAVSGTMVVTAMMAFVVVWKSWKWPALGCGGADRPLPAHRHHLPHRQHAQGVQWRLGAAPDRRLGHRHHADLAPRRDDSCRQDAAAGDSDRSAHSVAGEKSAGRACPGLPCSSPAAPDSAPTALLHSLKHYKVLHENNVILTIVTENVPRVAPPEPRARWSRSATASRG